MARKSDIQYIQYYTDGSAARKIELPPRKVHKKKVPKPRTRHEKTILLYVDPLALGGILIALTLLIAMITGFVQLSKTMDQKNALEAYVAQLKTENARMEETYRAGYDLEQIREEAAAYGMVPISEVETHELKVAVMAEEAPEVPGFWDKLEAFFAELFA